MDPTPTIFFVIVLSVFGGLLLGGAHEIFEMPSLKERESPENPGVLDRIFGTVTAAFDTVAWVIGSVWVTLTSIIRVATFNIPGAPTWVTVIFGGAIISVLSISVVKILRGVT